MMCSRQSESEMLTGHPGDTVQYEAGNADFLVREEV